MSSCKRQHVCEGYRNKLAISFMEKFCNVYSVIDADKDVVTSTKSINNAQGKLDN